MATPDPQTIVPQDQDDVELFPAESDPVNFWEEKQRELVTSVVDYNLGTLADLVRTKTIDLSPTYQRRFRWDDVRQSRLIESFLMNVPVPQVFLNEDRYGRYSVIDGKQRLWAISEFMLGRLQLCGLEVFNDVNGKTFEDLPSELQTVLKLRPTLRAVIVLRQSDLDIKFEVFQRLNTGGVRLNAQEIRNSTFPGPVNDMVLRLSEHLEFHKLLGIKSRAKSVLYQQMRDAEFVVRYFAFRDTWRDVSGGMKRLMDRFMADHQTESKDWIAEAEADFLQTVRAVDSAFGEHAFHRWQPSKEGWRRQVLASLFDAEMFACRGRDHAVLRAHREEILAGVKSLFDQNDFRQSIDAATNTPTYFCRRIEMVSDKLDELIGA